MELLDEFESWIHTLSTTITETSLSAIREKAKLITPVTIRNDDNDENFRKISIVVLQNVLNYHDDTEMFDVSSLKLLIDLVQTSGPIEPLMKAKLMILLHGTRLKVSSERLCSWFLKIKFMKQVIIKDEHDRLNRWKMLGSLSINHPTVIAAVNKLAAEVAGICLSSTFAPIQVEIIDCTLAGLRGFCGINTIYINAAYIRGQMSIYSTSYQPDSLVGKRVAEMDICTIAIHEFGHARLRQMSYPITYPSVRRDPSVSETYCDKSSSSVIVNDPYRWLEDPDSEETTQFVLEQNIISQDYLNKIPYRTKFFEHLKEVFNIPKFSSPSKQPNGKYYYFMNTGLQNQDVYFELDSLSKSTDQAQILIDPNTFSKDGTVAIQLTNFSHDGKILCYSVSDAGSDWSTIYFMDVTSRNKLDDIIIRTRSSSLCWTTDNRGIFYRTYADALNNTTANSTKKENKTEEDKDETTNEVESTTIEVTRTDIQEIYFHRLGTPRSSDICIARCIDDLYEHSFSVETSDDGQYLIASIRKGTLNENKLWFLPLLKSSDSIVEKPNWIKLIDNMDFIYDFVTSQDDLLYLKTNAQAENFRLITINTKTKEIKEIISEDKNDLLEDITCVYEKYFLVRYLSHVKSVLYLYEMKTGQQLRKFDLPIGNISVWGDQHESEIFIRLESFLSPTTIYTCDLAQSLDVSLTIFKRIEFEGVDLNALTTEQVFVNSNGLDSSNSVKVPMFLVHRKNLEKNGQNPIHIYVYGGFAIAMKPFFSIATLLWIYHFNGIFVLANVRGGGEYGEVWHKDAYKYKKKNTFFDVCACTEWLISNKYTQPEKVSITGGSNGGLTVAACANMRPDLFACVVIQVGVLDLYRYHKFTIGYYWCGEFGNPDIPEEFEWVKTISPLHNIPTNPTKYPSILVLTADHDDRVVPAHSFKYISQLQYQLGEIMNRLGRPLISRINVRAGHGAGKPTIKRIDELSDIYSFVSYTLGAQWHD